MIRWSWRKEVITMTDSKFLKELLSVMRWRKVRLTAYTHLWPYALLSVKVKGEGKQLVPVFATPYLQPMVGIGSIDENGECVLASDPLTLGGEVRFLQFIEDERGIKREVRRLNKELKGIAKVRFLCCLF